ncbi:2- 3 cyclic phosphodiesterase [Apiospora kogelbergensis]|uniref:2- 3 cyclic phosphodiesterase n=1 Tax=Apiospora kogelbergensis TaxID=1337665 RepID=UPI00312D6285
MPGSSLWLVPPPTHPLHAIISDLITRTLPSAFPDLTGPTFAPHMTLTSGIDPGVYGDDPQGWLDAVPWPRAAGVDVALDRVATQDVFFRRCYLQVAFEDGVRDLAGLARAVGVNGEGYEIGPVTREWLEEWREAFGPHVSLIYGSNPIDDQKLGEISKTVEEAGVSLSSSSEHGSGDASGGRGGWKGGVVWLVPTDKPIDEWKPIATRTLD